MSKTSSVTSSASSAANEYLSATHKVIQSYQASTITALTILFLLCADTPALHQVIDAYLVAVMLSGILQFVYCILVGTYPYNAFLAGFISSVGSFIFGANLRIQSNAVNQKEFDLGEDGKSVTGFSKRAFYEFILSHFVLHFFVVNFMG